MKKFKIGEVYEHTGREFFIKRRTEKSIWVARSKYGTPDRKVINHNVNGDESIKWDYFRYLTAGHNVKMEVK